MITIREATAADSKAIADLTQELGYAASPPSTRRRLAELQSSDNDIVLVATLSRSVVGWIHVQRVALLESDVFGEIKGLVVTEAQRGTGVGSQLVEAAEAWAREHSCPQLRVRSNVARSASASSFVTSIPLSPNPPKFLEGKKLKAPKSPIVPACLLL